MSSVDGGQTDETRKRDFAKRFYKSVEVRPQADAHGIFLDGHPVKTPLKRPLALPSRALADAVAAEWQAQQDRIVPSSMPINKLANTAIDHAPAKSGAIVDEFVSYAGADLLCYRADAPEGLVVRQQNLWDPLLTWAAQALGARLIVTTGIVHCDQSAAALAALRAQAETYDPFALTGLQTVTALTGSALIALALAERHIDCEAAWKAANVDEDWQIEQWGRDDDADRMRAARHRDLAASDRFLAIISADTGQNQQR